MTERRRLNRAAMEETIKQVVRRLMADHGPSRVTFAEVAREIGMTASALYRYFASRDELIAALPTLDKPET
jgi:AcrR family transcriptional regulator